jgi:hypothetical protein
MVRWHHPFIGNVRGGKAKRWKVEMSGYSMRVNMYLPQMEARILEKFHRM